MNRPNLISQFLENPLSGPQYFEGSRAATIEEQFNRSLTNLAADLPQAPYMINGWDISGGGGGAAWRASFEVSLSAGWGFNTSPPIGLTRAVFKEVRHAPQMRDTVLTMLGHLPPSAYVWGIKVASSSRDGTYLIGILYSLSGQGSGLLTYAIEDESTLGPFVAETTVLSVTIPQVISGIAAQQREYAVHYGLLLNDTTGASGVIARLKLNGGTVREAEYFAAATDWCQFSGCKYVVQSAASDVVVDLTVDVVGANVSCRGMHLQAFVQNSGGALG